MAKRENISVSFTPQQAEFLAACVASGRYQSTSEVVREAVRLLEDQQERRQAELTRLRALIREGADQLDRDEVVDGETGLLVKVNDPDALASALSSFVADQKRRAAFGKAGRARALDLYDERKVVARQIRSLGL